MNILYAIILIAGFAAFVAVMIQSTNDLLNGRMADDEPAQAQVRPLPAITPRAGRCA